MLIIHYSLRFFGLSITTHGMLGCKGIMRNRWMAEERKEKSIKIFPWDHLHVFCYNQYLLCFAFPLVTLKEAAAAQHT